MFKLYVYFLMNLKCSVLLFCKVEWIKASLSVCLSDVSFYTLSSTVIYSVFECLPWQKEEEEGEEEFEEDVD